MKIILLILGLSLIISDFQRKETTLKLLRKKALDRNPDEFHFHMINSQMNQGIHFEKRKDDEHTPDQIKLMQTQDINYVNYRRRIETNKIDRLKANLHLIDVADRPKNKHTFFADTNKQARKFNFAKKLNTLPELLDNFNCPNLDRLKDQVVNVDEKSLEQVTYLRDQSYNQLMKRVEREKLLQITSDKMEIKKKLMVIITIIIITIVNDKLFNSQNNLS